jgi:predicted component of type VI protein secretion system
MFRMTVRWRVTFSVGSKRQVFTVGSHKCDLSTVQDLVHVFKYRQKNKWKKLQEKENS